MHSSSAGAIAGEGGKGEGSGGGAVAVVNDIIHAEQPEPEPEIEIEPDACPIGSGGGTAGDPAECRICGEETTREELCIPCGCRGGSEMAHQRCVQTWINTKATAGLPCDTCEVCGMQWATGLFTQPAAPARPESTEVPDLQVQGLCSHSSPRRCLLGRCVHNGASMCQSPCPRVPAVSCCVHAGAGPPHSGIPAGLLPHGATD